MKKIRPCYDLTGKCFGNWEVIERTDCPPHIAKSMKNKSYWLCICLCGYEGIIRGTILRSGRSKSCGCGIYGKSV